jgi:hypothetical protein
MVGPAGFCVGCWYFGAEWLGARSGEAAAVVMLPRVAVHASTCRRRYRPTWLLTSGLSYLASVNAGQPVPSHSGGPGRWLGSHAALLRVGNGDYDRPNDHGGICDRRIRMIVEQDRRRYSEPRQQVNASTALSLRDGPMTARLLTELAGPPTTVVRALDRRARRRPVGPRLRCGDGARRNSSSSGAKYTVSPCRGERSYTVGEPQRSRVGNKPYCGSRCTQSDNKIGIGRWAALGGSGQSAAIR